MGCIYMFQNQVNSMVYIGKCQGNVKKRYNAHLRGDGNKPLKDAIDRHGIENFTFEILHDGILGEFLSFYEKEEIKRYNSVEPNGYNQTTGEGKPSEIARLKISQGQLGRIPWNKGKKGMQSHSPDVRRRISESSKGRKHSISTRQKLSEANKSPYYNDAYNLFSALRSDLPLAKKREIIRKYYSDKVNRTTILKWTKKWQSEKP